jgi:hypothetical protein
MKSFELSKVQNCDSEEAGLGVCHSLTSALIDKWLAPNNIIYADSSGK